MVIGGTCMRGLNTIVVAAYASHESLRRDHRSIPYCTGLESAARLEFVASVIHVSDLSFTDQA